MNTCPKNDKDKIYAKGTKYIHVEILSSMQCIVPIAGQK